MLLPINTDAPLYHFPFGTIGLIVVNVACFALSASPLDPLAAHGWALEYGEGLNPVQWFTSAFAHAGFLHLLGNVFFLWGFGLVVEGKLGWLRFIPLYLLLVTLSGAAVDLLTLHRTPEYVLSEYGCSSMDELEARLAAVDPELKEKLKQQGLLDPPQRPAGRRGISGWLREMVEKEADGADQQQGGLLEEISKDPFQVQMFAGFLVNAGQGRCVGASGVIFGLLGISLIWAPKNELELVSLVGRSAGTMDVSILAFCGLKIAVDVISWLLAPGMQTPGLHLTGLTPGLLIGAVMVRWGWVNCENWDLFNVLKGNHISAAAKRYEAELAREKAERYADPAPLPSPVEPGGENTADARKRGGRSRGRNQIPDSVNALIDQGDYLTAADELFNLRLHHSNLCPTEERTKRLSLGLIQADAWDQAEIWLQEFIDRFPDDNRWARIRLAELFLQQSRPRAALRRLKGLQTEGLHPQLLASARNVLQGAKALVEQGVADAEPDWS